MEDEGFSYIIGCCITAPILFFIICNFGVTAPFSSPFNWVLVILIGIVLSISISFLISKMGIDSTISNDSDLGMYGICCLLLVMCGIIYYMASSFYFVDAVVYVVLGFAVLVLLLFVFYSKN